MGTMHDEAYWTRRVERFIARGRADVVARWARTAGRPIRDARAAGIWRVLSGNWGPLSGAAAGAVYSAAGYRPFSGFPLERA